MLQQGRHDNSRLQQAFDKYGEDALRFSVLEKVKAPDDLISLEQHYIDIFRPEYNICQVAGNPPGVQSSQPGENIVSESKRVILTLRISEALFHQIHEHVFAFQAAIGRYYSQNAYIIQLIEYGLANEPQIVARIDQVV
jgi:hypothetical protein